MYTEDVGWLQNLDMLWQILFFLAIICIVGFLVFKVGIPGLERWAASRRFLINEVPRNDSDIRDDVKKGESNESE